MRGHEQVVSLLNDVLTAELTAINQYFIHGRMVEDILKAEEKHANWIEAQLTLIAQTGEGNYLAQQIKNEDA